MPFARPISHSRKWLRQNLPQVLLVEAVSTTEVASRCAGEDSPGALAGALRDSLEPFRRHGVSLSFIESRPSRRKNWEYHFYVDFLGHVSQGDVRKALEEFGEHCQFVKILGSYPRAMGPVN